MGRRVVHSLGAMQPDMRYVREGLRFAADLHRAGKFGEMAETLRELSAVLTRLEGCATDNFHGVEGSFEQGFSDVYASDDARRAAELSAVREAAAMSAHVPGDPFASREVCPGMTCRSGVWSFDKATGVLS